MISSTLNKATQVVESLEEPDATTYPPAIYSPFFYPLPFGLHYAAGANSSPVTALHHARVKEQVSDIACLYF